jgi:phosphoglycerol transferase MdoB-like AlkP superfamily enzyme
VNTRAHAGRRALGPLPFLFGFLAFGLGLLSLSRGVLALRFLERVRLEPHFVRAFLLGVRIDLVVLCYALVVPVVALLTLPRAWLRRARAPLAGYAALVMGLLAAMEAISPGYVAQFDVRPNRLFVENMGSSEVLTTVWTAYPWQIAVAVLVTLGAGLFAGWLGARLLRQADAWGLGPRLATLPLVSALLFLGMRGTLAHRPINAAMVAFSGLNLVNQLALNSTYTVGRACYDVRHERSSSHLYGSMPDAEVLERVGRYTRFDAADLRAGAVPFQHVQRSVATGARPRNLVIVLEESLGAEFVGALGGKPLTPNLDALAREGLWLTRLYCTGTRTVRGIEAVVCGFLPTPGSSVVKLSRSQSDFFTVAGLLRRHGYATDFVYGGESHFDNMAGFFLANGFERALGEDDYESPAFRGTWGVSDEDLVRKADELFTAHGDRPFFALVLSTSNHSPFEYPDGRIERYDAEKNTRNNTVRYADHALGELFRVARTRPYWDDTVWVVVADHDERTYGDDLLPVSKFHIPGLILAPGLRPATFDRVASQIDLVPTALGLLGIETEQPMIGRDLLALPPDDPGRAILQFDDIHGLLVGDRLAVHPGASRPLCFEVHDGHLVSVPDDPELLRDALAHALLPGLLYERGLYRLPSAPPDL